MYEDLDWENARRLARLAVWAAFMALGAWVVIPVAFIPVTLQTFFIFLAGFAEGPRAAISAALYLGAGLLGLPVFSGGQAGPALVFGPSVGYAFSFPAVAAICGLGRGKGRPGLARMLPLGLAGMALMYSCGSLGLVVNAGFSWPAALFLNVTFLPGDLAKMVCAALAARSLAPRLGQRGAPAGPRSLG
ncbi:MAG: biotin transporter BioY [Deltaproteobacteria bacterium]|jgi:biotin transport system substrate-specific component|nr:biotin transporter BioY [Deltaproteobacteria bacterium]